MRLLLLIPIFALLNACTQEPPPEPPPRPALVEHPQPLAGQTGEVFPGAVRAREETDLGFRVAGKILKRLVEPGQQVKKGQTLATLDPEDAALNLQASEAAANAAEADLRLAESELARNKELLDKGFLSKSLYDVRENTVSLTRARLDQAKSALAVVRNQTRYNTLEADKDGLITAQMAEAGQVVGAAQPVFRLAASGGREVLIHVPEGRLDALRKSQLNVTLWANPGKVYPGRLREANLQADRATRTHEARIAIENADADVQLGMTATVIMGSKIDAGSFIVPLTALGGATEKPAVWVVAAGKAHSIPVQVLRYLETGAVVAGALTPQMDMVSAGAHLLVEGQAVTTRPRERNNLPQQ